MKHNKYVKQQAVHKTCINTYKKKTNQKSQVNNMYTKHNKKHNNNNKHVGQKACVKYVEHIKNKVNTMQKTKSTSKQII